MRFLGKLLSMATFIYCPQCIKYLDIQNQALYNEIVDHFFPKELGHPGIDIRRNLYKYSFNGKCCRCTKTCRYYGTCCIDAFFNNNITSVEEYIDIFFNMTKIRKHIETLPIVNIADTSVKFRVQKLPMVASCGNKGSVYASLCNASDPGDETRVIADGFVYKNKHCALCHGFEIYSNASLELVNCHTSVNIAGIEMIIPDESCTLRIIEGNGTGHMEEKVNVSVYLPERNELDSSLEDVNSSFHSFFALINEKYANPYYSNCIAEANLPSQIRLAFPNKNVYMQPHFRLLISLDGHGNSNSDTDRGNLICPCGQYFDIFSNQCKNNLLDTCENNIPSDIDSTYFKRKAMGVQLSLSLKTLEKLYRCIKQLGGTVIRRNSTLKKIDCIQTDERFRNVLGELGKLLQQFFVPFKKFPETQLYGFSPQRHFLHGRVCADPEIINQSFEITSGCDVSLNDTTYRINEDVTYWINITADHVSYAAARCNHFHLAPNCNIGVLNSSHVTMKNNSVVEVVINKENKSYTPEQYLPLLEGLGICFGNDKCDKKDPAWLKHYYYFENILSLSLLSVSIILELLSLFTYISREKRRKIAERNLIAFFSVLLMCDIIGLITTLLKLTARSFDLSPCKTVAVLLHFFSLALCMWPAIIAYEYYKIFRSGSFLEQPSMLYLRYCATAFGIPFIVVSICVMINVLSNRPLLQYGANNICWILPLYARLFVYIVPFVVMTFGSFSLVFIVTLQTQREKRKNHCMLAKTDQIGFSKMVIKLCFLFGTAELIGLVQIPNNVRRNEFEVIVNVIFGLVYNFLRSSRGIFMFVLFSYNRSRTLS